MTTQVPPKKNIAFTCYVSLVSRSGRPQFQANPTLAAGDVKVAIDDGSPANLTTLPVVDADFTKRVKVSLSAAEMNGDVITVLFSDAAGDEWDDLMIEIHTATNQIDNLALASAVAALNNLSAADVWAHTPRTLTQGAAAVQAAMTGSDITVYRGTSWSFSLTGLGDLSTYDVLYFSVKHRLDDPDADAILQVKNAASGLVVLNQAEPELATNGTITIDDEADGDITITVEEDETVNAPLVEGLLYDVKGIDGDGDVVLLSVGGLFSIAGDVTRAIE